MLALRGLDGLVSNSARTWLSDEAEDDAQLTARQTGERSEDEERAVPEALREGEEPARA